MQRLVSDHMAGRAMGPDDPAYRAYLDWIDPFRDGRGHERFGILIGWAVGLMEQHRHADRVIPLLADRYAAQFGADRIVRVRWPYDSNCTDAEPSKRLEVPDVS